ERLQPLDHLGVVQRVGDLAGLKRQRRRRGELQIEPHRLRQMPLPVVHADARLDPQIVNKDLVHLAYNPRQILREASLRLLPAIAIIVGAYLIGSISFAVVVSRAFGLPDPHEYGSGNPGATNVLRTGNKAAALLTLAGDGIKGWLAVVLAGVAGHATGAPEWVVPAAGLAVFLGHLYPV